MLGEKIRRLRTERGLSQSQLAGKEMTRAFISQVENGHCTPSAQTLRILADRLGKPLSYFLEDGPADDQGARLLFESAEADMRQAAWAGALPKLEEALKLVRRLDDTQWENQIQHFIGSCLYHLQQYDAALARLEEVQERYRLSGKTADACQTWLEMAYCYTYLEQYSSARRLYEKVIRHTAGMKSMQEMHINGLVYLGTAHLRTGELELAVRAYQEALGAIDPTLMSVMWGRVASGLGAAYNQLGKADLARDWSKQAITRLKVGSTSRLIAEHNLALALRNLGQWEEAYAILQRVLTGYRELNDAFGQANVMEDIVQHWLHKGDLDRAEQVCWEAIDVIPESRSARLRGLLYSHLGHIHAQRGQRQRAWELLKVSEEFLTRAQAADKLDQVSQELRDMGPRERGAAG